MNRKWRTAAAVTVTMTGVALALSATAGSASADTINLPNHARTWTTDAGYVATVASTQETITRVPGMVGATTREAFVTLKATASLKPIAGKAQSGVKGKLQNGYQVGCATTLDSVGPSIGWSLGINGGGSGPVPGWSVGPSAGINGSVGLTLKPGQESDILFDTKEFSSGSASTVSREIHLHVDQCVGPVTIRSFAILQVSSPSTDDSNAVYGRVFSP